ncbi:hypothetical protein C7212DRAFT_303960, partial [Tuber magnatum]
MSPTFLPDDDDGDDGDDEKGKENKEKKNKKRRRKKGNVRSSGKKQCERSKRERKGET